MDRLEEIKERVDASDRFAIEELGDYRWLLIEIARMTQRARKAESEVERLRVALLEISEWDNGTENEIARRALAGEG